MIVVFWVPQVLATIQIIETFRTYVLSTPEAVLSVAIIGASTAFLCRLCWAEGGNAARGSYWVTTGVYSALGHEVKHGFARAVKHRIDILLDSK
jgi:hypothetical protein